MKTLSSADMAEQKILVHEPFAEFLEAETDEIRFSISLLDIVRFAGHACPAMVGAFLISKKAVEDLFPSDKTLFRGSIFVEMPNPVEAGATGPISNVFSYIFGSWDKSGFGGLQGQFTRRNLLKYAVPNLDGAYRFTHLGTRQSVLIKYNPSLVAGPPDSDHLSFQKIWRYKISEIVNHPEKYISAELTHLSGEI